jgi:hypothetical protein
MSFQKKQAAFPHLEFSAHMNTQPNRKNVEFFRKQSLMTQKAHCNEAY